MGKMWKKKSEEKPKDELFFAPSVETPEPAN